MFLRVGESSSFQLNRNGCCQGSRIAHQEQGRARQAARGAQAGARQPQGPEGCRWLRWQAHQDLGCPQVDCSRHDRHHPDPACPAPPLLPEEELPSPGPPCQEDPRHPSPSYQARGLAQDPQAAEEGDPLPSPQVRHQGINGFLPCFAVCFLPLK